MENGIKRRDATYVRTAAEHEQRYDHERMIKDLSAAQDGLSRIMSRLAAAFAANGMILLTAQPKNVQASEGKTATFAVEAFGDGISYQWRESINGGSSWNNISGATGAVLKLPSVTASMSGRVYSCRITCGGASATTKTVQLTVT